MLSVVTIIGLQKVLKAASNKCTKGSSLSANSCLTKMVVLVLCSCSSPVRIRPFVNSAFLRHLRPKLASTRPHTSWVFFYETCWFVFTHCIWMPWLSYFIQLSDFLINSASGRSPQSRCCFSSLIFVRSDNFTPRSIIEYKKTSSCSPFRLLFLRRLLLIFDSSSSHQVIFQIFGFSSKTFITGAIRSRNECLKSMYSANTSNIGNALRALDSFMCFFFVSVRIRSSYRSPNISRVKRSDVIWINSLVIWPVCNPSVTV